MRKIHTQSEQGFTLIELLVVLAIIALLAATILTSVFKAQKKGRDTRRVEDINSLFKAIQLYSVDHAKFPACTDPATAPTSLSTSTFSSSSTIASSPWTEVNGGDALTQALLGDRALEKVITDPLGDASSTFSIDNPGYWYITNGDCNNFALRFCMETNRVEGYKSGCSNVITLHGDVISY